MWIYKGMENGKWSPKVLPVEFGLPSVSPQTNKTVSNLF